MRVLANSCAVVLLACSQARVPVTAQPESPAAPHVVDVAVVAPTQSPPRDAAKPATVQPTSPDAPVQLGPCRYTEHGSALSSFAPAAPAAAPVSSSVNYGAFRQKKQIWVGYGGLIRAELSSDEQSLMVLSDQDGIARSYSIPGGKAGPHYAHPGYEVLTRVSVTWWPNSRDELLVGSERGIELVSLSGRSVPRTLSAERSWDLQWDRSRSVLGSVAARIPEQTGVLTFFQARHIENEPQLTALATLDCDERIDGWALSPSLKWLLLTHYPSNHVALYDLQQRRQLWSVPGPNYVGTVDISADGSLGAAAGDQVWLFPLLQPDERRTFTKLGNNVHQVRFSPDPRALAVAAYDGKVRLLATTLQPAAGAARGAPAKELTLLKLLRHSGSANVYPVTFSRDGRLLITSSGDQTVRLWGN